MSKMLLKTLLLLLLPISFLSCDKEDSVVDVENFILHSVYEIEESTGAGMAGCYELVFPISLLFADGTTQEVEDYDDLKLTIREWFEANAPVRPRPFLRPVLVLPVDVITEDGEVITVETHAGLLELRRACISANFGSGHSGHLGRDRACFRLVYPFAVTFPDGSEVTVNTPRELQLAVRTWRFNNPGAPGHTEFVYPLTVRLRDGTQVEVNSPQELRALKAECRG